MAKKDDPMVNVAGQRFRQSVAKRLGLTIDGKVMTARSNQSGTTTTAHVKKMQDAAARATKAAKTEAKANGETVAPEDRPANSRPKPVWVAYALANGKTKADLEGLTRDQIAELFPVDGGGDGASPDDGASADGNADGEADGEADEGDGSGN